MFKPIVIRLQKRNIRLRTSYYIVVMYKSCRNRGAFLDKLGYFDNVAKNRFVLNTFKLAYWLNRGAKINKTCLKYLSKIANGYLVESIALKKKN